MSHLKGSRTEQNLKDAFAGESMANRRYLFRRQGRRRSDKTAAVHFLRFELDPAMIASWNTGVPITLASTLPAMPVEVTLMPEQRCMLAADFV